MDSDDKKFLITLLVTGVIGGVIGVLAGGLVGLFIGLFFGIGLGMFWGFTKYNLSTYIKIIPEQFAEQCADGGIIQAFFITLIVGILIFLLHSIWAFIKSPFVTIYRLITRNFTFDPDGIPNVSSSSGENDLFIHLNNGDPLTIGSDNYIYSKFNYKIGFINGSVLTSRGRQIGEIKGNDIYDFNGNLICHIVDGHLVK